MLVEEHLVKAETVGEQALLGDLRQDLMHRARRWVNRHHEQAKPHEILFFPAHRFIDVNRIQRESSAFPAMS